MQEARINLSVSQATDFLKQSIQEKGLTLFSDIDHQANAKAYELKMPASRLLIFGHPQAGTRLMQENIKISIELPLRLAIVDNNGETLILYPNVSDYGKQYQLNNQQVLQAMETLFATLLKELTSYSEQGQH